MALDVAGLKAKIKAAYESVANYDGTPGKTSDDALEKISTDLSQAIMEFVMSGTVTTTVAAGIAVQVNIGTGTGATSAPGAGTGSVS